MSIINSLLVAQYNRYINYSHAAASVNEIEISMNEQLDPFEKTGHFL
ncbi:MAG: hypothetical protein IPP96_05230 [Chitinophagaceae bacterium]|nr:hypothetical protein [Chitinophagaceae bacterium]